MFGCLEVPDAIAGGCHDAGIDLAGRDGPVSQEQRVGRDTRCPMFAANAARKPGECSDRPSVLPGRGWCRHCQLRVLTLLARRLSASATLRRSPCPMGPIVPLFFIEYPYRKV